jgi:hypothetical protein
MVVTDGAGAGAAVLNANPTEAGGGTVTSVGGTGTVNGISLSGTVTSSGNLTLGGTLANVDLTHDSGYRHPSCRQRRYGHYFVWFGHSRFSWYAF